MESTPRASCLWSSCELILSSLQGITTTPMLFTRRRSSWLVALAISADYGIASQCPGLGAPIMEPQQSCLPSKCAGSTVSTPFGCMHSVCSHNLVISFYSSTIFENVGYTATEALYASLGYGAVQVVFTIPTLFLIDTKGRRTLCMIVSSRPTFRCTRNRQLTVFVDISSHVSLLACGWFVLAQR